MDLDNLEGYDEAVAKITKDLVALVALPWMLLTSIVFLLQSQL